MWGITRSPGMKRNPSYLTLNRHGTFYFRIVIPVSLRAILNGQREIRRTLKTDSRRLACKRARQYAARYEATFDRVMNVVKRDELGLTESDYEEMMELMDLVEQLPDFSDPLMQTSLLNQSYRTKRLRSDSAAERWSACLLALTDDRFPLS